jgi:hypothetical protein
MSSERPDVSSTRRPAPAQPNADKPAPTKAAKDERGAAPPRAASPVEVQRPARVTEPQRDAHQAAPQREARATEPRRDTQHAAPQRETIGPEERRQRIAERAYYKALARGFGGGEVERDWLEAEREVDEELLRDRPSRA